MANKIKKGKKGAAKKEAKIQKNPLFERAPRNFRIGGDVQPQRDLTRFVRWPKYIRLQRQKRVLLQRLKVPPAINQFSSTLDRIQAQNLFKLLDKYKPETKLAKKQRLEKEAQNKADDKSDPSKKPHVLKFGINHVTELIEAKKAKLVVIASDVDPIELIVWLPALCRKKDVPYCIVKDKSRLGKLVHLKTATCVALTDIKKEDTHDLDIQVKNCRAAFNDSYNDRKWGGGIMGLKSQHKIAKREKLLEQERLKKAQLA